MSKEESVANVECSTGGQSKYAEFETIMIGRGSFLREEIFHASKCSRAFKKLMGVGRVPKIRFVDIHFPEVYVGRTDKMFRTWFSSHSRTETPKCPVHSREDADW
jgi:hypothetical protein